MSIVFIALTLMFLDEKQEEVEESTSALPAILVQVLFLLLLHLLLVVEA